MAGYIHKTLHVPLGLLTHPGIPLPYRLLLYFSQGPDVNWVSSRKLAVIMGLDVSTPKKADQSASQIRVTRSRMVTDGLLQHDTDASGHDGFRAVVPDAAQSALDMLGSLDANVYVNPSSEEKETGHAPSIRLPATVTKGWDHIPWYGAEERFTKLMPFAFTTDRKELKYFWDGFRARVASIMKRSKTTVPAAVVSMMVFMWTVDQVRKNGYPPTIKSRGGYFLKTLIGKGFPNRLLKDQRAVQEALKALGFADGTLALRAYLRENDTTKVAQFSFKTGEPASTESRDGRPQAERSGAASREGSTDASGGPVVGAQCSSGSSVGMTNSEPDNQRSTDDPNIAGTELAKQLRNDLLRDVPPEKAKTMRETWAKDDARCAKQRAANANGTNILGGVGEMDYDQQIKAEEARWQAFCAKERARRDAWNATLAQVGKPRDPQLTDEELAEWYRDEYPESLVTM